jgi:hypothetical protein
MNAYPGKGGSLVKIEGAKRTRFSLKMNFSVGVNMYNENVT